MKLNFSTNIEIEPRNRKGITCGRHRK